jgi:serine/threonine protein kinase
MDRTALPPGTRLAELEILRVLAVGGFGVVYLARDHSLDRDVAVKEFMPAMLAQRGDGQRVTVRSAPNAQTYALGLRSFIDEAKLLARISHPAVVKVYRFWEANGTGYMVMPYLRGPTLGDVRRSMSAAPTEAWLRSVIHPLLDALAMLHDEGYYHRDIAPDNVLVSGDGQPVLLDFGAARRVIGDRTQAVTAILKPHFAPIEQYAEAKQLRQGAWTDLYALGALVAYLIDGAPPPPATARAVHDEMEPLAARRIADISARFLGAIDWALAVLPKDRPQSVAELRDALDGRLAPRPLRGQPFAAARPEPIGDSRAVALRRFAQTEHMERPSARVPLLPADIAHTQRRPIRRAWSFPAAGVLVAVALAWPLAKLRPDGVADDVPDATPKATLVASAATTSLPPVEARSPMRVETPVPSETAFAPPIESSLEDVAAAAAKAVPASLRPVRAPAARARLDKTARASRPNEALQSRKQLAALRAARPGPIELCAERNFFIRPWCVQRHCEEARFRGSAQCSQLRPVARYDRY